MSKYKIIAYLADWADWSVQDIDAKSLPTLTMHLPP